MTVKDIDSSPRRVWSGLTLPGKKMMVLLLPDNGIQRGRELIDLYKGEPYMEMIKVALALHALPSQAAQFGPALGELGKPMSHPGVLYGAILADIRDFLKLRFRAEGFASTETKASEVIDEWLNNGRIQATLRLSDPEPTVRELAQQMGDQALWVSYLINYMITGLRKLVRESANLEREEIVIRIHQMRDILRVMARLAYRVQYSEYPSLYESTDTFDDSLFEESTA